MFDTDSRPVGMDSRASACISDDPADFPHGYTLTNKKVKVFGGLFHGKVYQGILRWNFQEDDGTIDSQEIPGSYYIPEGGMRLLSPQHWSQQRSAQGLEKQHYHASVKTAGKQMIMRWNGGKSIMTIPIHSNTNVASFRLAPGYGKHHLFAQEAGMIDDDSPVHAIQLQVLDASLGWSC